MLIVALKRLSICRDFRLVVLFVRESLAVLLVRIVVRCLWVRGLLIGHCHGSVCIFKGHMVNTCNQALNQILI